MAAQARTLARRSGLEATVWTKKDLARDGFGGLLAVGGGSHTPPRLVRLDYSPKATPDEVSEYVDLTDAEVLDDTPTETPEGQA